ncbi:P-loop NTPase fold protein [Listeria rustica]|uniref:KAP NTPase domain-containing protein n=1 Tax=Listeria rustica TaxID=2713503 RepID=A0A7W1YGP2_9LIST|nr:P-loop NTPase fold protein [Listeria rustica]MBA3926897.1 hypothetical protein [Listeria rustica]
MIEHDMKPLDNEFLEHAIFSSTLMIKIADIESILRNLYLGTYIIGGHRGAGKTTLINSIEKKFVMDSYQHLGQPKHIRYKFLHLNVANDKTDLLRELVLFIEKIYDENWEKYEEIVDDKKIFKKKKIMNKRYEERINSLKEKVLFDIFLEEIKEDSVADRRNRYMNVTFSLKDIFLNAIPFKLGINKEIKHLAYKEIRNRRIKSPRQRKEDLIAEVIDLIDILSKEVAIVIIMDELDKMNNTDFKKFMRENKTIFTESSAVFFLLVDHIKYVSLKYDKSFAIMHNLIRDYIYLPRLNWKEFLLVVPKILKISNLRTLRSIYYYSKGNYREVVKIKKDYNNLYGFNAKLDHQSSLRDIEYINDSFYIVVGLVENDYISDLPEPLKEIAIDFIFDIIDMYQINKSITSQELNEVKEEYLMLNPTVNSVIKRVGSIISDYKCINVPESEESLATEISKYYGSKHPNFKGNNYRPVLIETTEISMLYRLIGIYHDSIDGVIICKEEQADTQFNISYTATILVSSDYMQPVAYINHKGFAWNFEVGHRYYEMLSYLDENEIIYIDIELPINQSMVQRGENLKPFLDKLINKQLNENQGL